MRCVMCGIDLMRCTCGEVEIEKNGQAILADLGNRVLKIRIQYPLKGLFEALEKEIKNLEVCAEMEKLISDLKELF